MNKILAVIGSVICLLIAIALVKVLISFDGIKTHGKGILFRINNGKTNITINDYSEKEIANEYSFSADKIKSIKASLASESIYFEKTSGSEVKVYFIGDWTDITTHADVNENELYITADRKKTIKLFSISNRFVKVEVPASKNDFSEINCEIASGSIHINNFKAGQFELYTASGSIRLSDCSSKETNVNSASGSITFENCNFLDSEAKAASGSMHFNDCSITSLSAKSASGSIHIDGSYDSLNIHSSSGSIHVDLDKPLTKDSYFDSTSGSINLNLPENSNFKLKYQCTSGRMKNALTGTEGKSGTDIYGTGNPIIETYATSGSIRINKN